VVPQSASGERLDRFLSAEFPAFSRAQLQRLIADHDILRDGQPTRPAERLRPGQVIELVLPPPEPTGIVPTAMPIDVIYESPDLLVLNKPAGLVVHPAPGHATDTLANALMARYPDLAVGQAMRPGLVHRLDQGTSGLMVVALSDRAYQHLVAELKRRAVQKHYLALVHGEVGPTEGTIEAPIGRDRVHRQKMAVVPEGRPSRTGFRVRERFPGYTLLRLKLDTGRTHQIRVHLAAIGHPVVGDTVYGPAAPSLGLSRPFLHAWHLGFLLPDGEACFVGWAPLPSDLNLALDSLRA
jgi:23S rRNA pseudouridine1911/1915/1917 synthase